MRATDSAGATVPQPDPKRKTLAERGGECYGTTRMTVAATSAPRPAVKGASISNLSSVCCCSLSLLLQLQRNTSHIEAMPPSIFRVLLPSIIALEVTRTAACLASLALHICRRILETVWCLLSLRGFSGGASLRRHPQRTVTDLCPEPRPASVVPSGRSRETGGNMKFLQLFLDAQNHDDEEHSCVTVQLGARIRYRQLLAHAQHCRHNLGPPDAIDHLSVPLSCFLNLGLCPDRR